MFFPRLNCIMCRWGVLRVWRPMPYQRVGQLWRHLPWSFRSRPLCPGCFLFKQSFHMLLAGVTHFWC